jgi:hypothetical protein
VLAGMERVAEQIRAEREAADPSAEASEPPRLKELSPAEPVVQDWSSLTDDERAALVHWRQQCVAVAARNRETAKQIGPYEAAERPVTITHALVRLATQALDAPGLKPMAVKERLKVQVDPLSGWARLRNGELLPPGTVAKPEGSFTSLDLTALDAGRTSREVPLPLRRLLGNLDGERCRFPGCTRVTHLHAHHVRYWSQGGCTDLANLVLVCSRHHTLIHSQGFQLVLTPDRRLTVRTADDIPVPHHPGLPQGDCTALPADASAETLPPQVDTRPIDWDWAVQVIAAQAG